MTQSRRTRGRPRDTEVAKEVSSFRKRRDSESPLPVASAAADDRSLSARQRQVLETIEASVHSNGYPPSMREIGKAVGLASLSSVAHQLNQLEKLGYLRRDPKRPRAIEVVNPAEIVETPAADTSANAAAIPVVGRIAAGGPITAEQNVDDVFVLPRQVVGAGDNLFLLNVVGDSMIDAAICHGDWVVVRSQPTAENGEIVAALLDDEATVKTLKRKDGKQWLLPQNPDYEPIDGTFATIMGVVTAVIRRV
ncbi:MULTISPECIES: transcriptional repressor LexA [Brevibacterium]|uniref:LexA repressor n=1 Tax=Brevibacterium ravenspurgense TaxID=479117 RepID=A0A150HDA3_9MICO|nr:MULTISPECIES: transcriptional repressor LexA [Brevibacterium]KXZ59778.1 LexA repressor [Brevibacterium ravenspurgense]MCG7300469.1 transcriptional repressor LexA [Brevibacterium ravenspurgense]OFT98626.1 repressor LexA [Brevibacterium sp. HMSC22B09]